jgi:hypothetical protein
LAQPKSFKNASGLWLVKSDRLGRRDVKIALGKLHQHDVGLELFDQVEIEPAA